MATIAVPIGPEYEDSEFDVPTRALREAGHKVVTVGVQRGATVKGKRGESSTKIDATPSELEVSSLACVLIPGGHSPDHLRTNGDVVRLIEDAVRADIPIAAICHGPQLLIEAHACRGLRMTSAPAIRTDLMNAGAHWEDEAVVRDGNFITSRTPQDLEEFTRATLERIAQTP